MTYSGRTDAAFLLAHSTEIRMTPLTEDDLELEALLWRNFCREEFEEYLDQRRYDDEMSEDEAYELADGAQTRPFTGE